MIVRWIENKPYVVSVIASDDGWTVRITKADGSVYTVRQDSCTCVGHKYYGRCKHVEWVRRTMDP